MAKGPSKHRPVFHLMVLASGFVSGGLLTQVARRFLPAGAVKEFLTTGVTPAVGPLPVDLIILKFAVGPVALDVSLLSLLGVLIAYLIARSLF
ncbi:DUF4321 domain-containing protein [Gemmatimonas sp.]|jgi:hypothetical protein|uniref:DUF4321 domain-containing protein n=2 Tax=Gemmatimonas sp. TaxID=1962908 RepID=UPI0022C46E73|nr:DUF4321 domain-containing protein [Gemmatimonas sp.]MCA2986875.1 DUF4321 domain-containing protein [Gemmatimonas sp.]MCA2991238.1 DUF4321 domain-containing protein [Gemmatimonas sp.]MCE2953925.1 DUF4321 domain-containing protein [Gemmatimonas sp.]MCZ8265515.1 DUF4321 domain-containing protein [Gemmatimonas sp.]